MICDEESCALPTPSRSQALEEERRLVGRLTQQYEDELAGLRASVGAPRGSSEVALLRDELERARAELRKRNDDVLLLREEMDQLRR